MKVYSLYGGHVDVGTAPDVGFDDARSLYDLPCAVDEPTEVVAGLKIKDWRNEFERVLICTSQVGTKRALERV